MDCSSSGSSLVANVIPRSKFGFSEAEPSMPARATGSSFRNAPRSGFGPATFSMRQ